MFVYSAVFFQVPLFVDPNQFSIAAWITALVEL